MHPKQRRPLTDAGGPAWRACRSVVSGIGSGGLVYHSTG
jgi:hypothetical protein